MKLPPIGMVDPESFSLKLCVSQRGMNWKMNLLSNIGRWSENRGDYKN